jgi:hypothetical protein
MRHARTLRVRCGRPRPCTERSLARRPAPMARPTHKPTAADRDERRRRDREHRSRRRAPCSARRAGRRGCAAAPRSTATTSLSRVADVASAQAAVVRFDDMSSTTINAVYRFECVSGSEMVGAPRFCRPSNSAVAAQRSMHALNGASRTSDRSRRSRGRRRRICLAVSPKRTGPTYTTTSPAPRIWPRLDARAGEG